MENNEIVISKSDDVSKSSKGRSQLIVFINTFQCTPSQLLFVATELCSHKIYFTLFNSRNNEESNTDCFDKYEELLASSLPDNRKIVSRTSSVATGDADESHAKNDNKKLDIPFIKVMIAVHPFHILCRRAEECGWTLVQPSWVTEGKCLKENLQTHTLHCSLHNARVCTSGLTENERSQLRQWCISHHCHLYSQLRHDCNLLIVSNTHYTSLVSQLNMRGSKNNLTLESSANVEEGDVACAIKQNHFYISSPSQLISLQHEETIPQEQFYEEIAPAKNTTTTNHFSVEEEEEREEGLRYIKGKEKKPQNTKSFSEMNEWEPLTSHLPLPSSKITFALRHDIPITSFSHFQAITCARHSSEHECVQLQTSLTHTLKETNNRLTHQLNNVSNTNVSSSDIRGMENMYCYFSPPEKCTLDMVEIIESCGAHLVHSLSPHQPYHFDESNINIDNNNNHINTNTNNYGKLTHIIVLTEKLCEVVFPHPHVQFVRLEWLLSCCRARKLLPLTPEWTVLPMTLKPVLTFTGISSHEKHVLCSALHNTIHSPFLIQDVFILGLPREELHEEQFQAEEEEEKEWNMEEEEEEHQNVYTSTNNKEYVVETDICSFVNSTNVTKQTTRKPMYVNSITKNKKSLQLANTTHLIAPLRELYKSRKVSALVNRVLCMNIKRQGTFCSISNSNSNNNRAYTNKCSSSYSQECVLVDVEWVKEVVKAEKWVDWTPYILPLPAAASLTKEEITIREVQSYHYKSVTNGKKVDNRNSTNSNYNKENYTRKMNRTANDVDLNSSIGRGVQTSQIEPSCFMPHMATEWERKEITNVEECNEKQQEEQPQQERNSYKRFRDEDTQCDMEENDHVDHSTQVCLTLEKLLDHLEETEVYIDRIGQQKSHTNSTTMESLIQNKNSNVATTHATTSLSLSKISYPLHHNTALMSSVDGMQLEEIQSVLTTAKIAEAAGEATLHHTLVTGESQVVYYHRESDDAHQTRAMEVEGEVDAGTPHSTSQTTLSEQSENKEQTLQIDETAALHESSIRTPSTCLLEAYETTTTTLYDKQRAESLLASTTSGLLKAGNMDTPNQATSSASEVWRANHIYKNDNKESALQTGTAFMKTPVRVRDAPFSLSKMPISCTALLQRHSTRTMSTTIRLLIASDVKRTWSNQEIESYLGKECLLVDEAAACTHFVIAKPTKTEAFLCCLAAKKCIVKPSFLEACVAQRKLVPVEAHQWNVSYAQQLNLRPSLVQLNAGIERQSTARTLPFTHWNVHLCCSTPERSKSFYKILVSGGCERVNITSPEKLCLSSTLEQTEQLLMRDHERKTLDAHTPYSESVNNGDDICKYDSKKNKVDCVANSYDEEELAHLNLVLSDVNI